jgi:hypothetical protein
MFLHTMIAVDSVLIAKHVRKNIYDRNANVDGSKVEMPMLPVKVDGTSPI